MRPFFRLFFISIATLFVVGLFSTHEVKAQAIAPHDVLISEFRLSGPGGDSDEFIEFYCNRDTDCDISNFSIQAFDPSSGDFLTSFPANTLIPARQYLLVANSIGYTLAGYATLDLDVSNPDFPDFFIDNEGIQLLADDGTTVIDSVGFTGGGNEATYVEGTGLQRATSARPADQYSYVRKRTLATAGLPQDTDNNANDFVLVSVTGTPHPGITTPPVLRAPGPQGLSSPPTFSSAQVPDSLVEPAASSAASPNRVRTGSGNSGTLSIRRSLTNNTAQPFDYVSFRVIEIPTLNSPVTITNQAQLRLVTSGDAETFTNSQGRTVVIRGSILEFDDGMSEPNQPNGGGLNSTVHVNLSEGQLIQPGETVDVQFLLNIVQSGNYRFFLYVEAFPTSGPPPAVSQTAQRVTRTSRAALRPVATRHLVNLKRRTPFVLQILKKSKTLLAVPVITVTSHAGTNVVPPAPVSNDAARPTRARAGAIQKNN